MTHEANDELVLVPIPIQAVLPNSNQNMKLYVTGNTYQHRRTHYVHMRMYRDTEYE